MSIKQPLKVEIIDGRLIASIGIDVLPFAVQAGQNWPDGAIIKNNLAFAQDMKDALEKEQEDGTTVIHLAFDTAAQEVLENCDSVGPAA